VHAVDGADAAQLEVELRQVPALDPEPAVVGRGLDVDPEVDAVDARPLVLAVALMLPLSG
jgi:hypothetical protein